MQNRRSWHEDGTRLTQSQFTLAGHGSGESDNRDSDNSAEEPATTTPLNLAEPFRRNTSGTGSLRGYKPRDEVALRRSHRDLSSHRSSIAGEFFLFFYTFGCCCPHVFMVHPVLCFAVWCCCSPITMFI